MNLLKYTYYVFVAVVLMNSSSLFAQSEHYWSQSFNTESSLVAGAVAGGTAGPSAVYYNPALINEDDANRLSLSANLFSMQYTRINNLAGENTFTDRFNFIVQPKFLSYNGKISENRKITYELAFLTPVKKDLRIDYFYDSEVDIIKRLDGIESYTGSISYKDKYQDLYFGGGVSYKFNERFSFGVSGFFSLKLLELSSDISNRALQDADTVYSNGVPEPYYSAFTSYTECVKYWDLSLLLKFGFHYKSANERLGLGINLSLPNIHIYGEGKVGKEYKRAKVYNDLSNSFTENLDFVGFQKHVLTHVKDPFSIALGMEYWTKEKRNAIMITTEYFFKIKSYKILNAYNPSIVTNQNAFNSNDALSYYSSSSDVFNIALGYVRYFSEHLTVAGGIKTDFNSMTSFTSPIGHNDLMSTGIRNLELNKYHFVVGPSFNIKTFGVVLGLQYSWGRKRDLLNFANFSDPNEFNPETSKSLQGIQENNMVVKYNEISIFFGVTYGFGSKKK